MKRMTIAVLEDNGDRISVMQTVLADKFPFYSVIFCRSADAIISWLREHMDETIGLALDHDLERIPGQSDPGSGRDVARFLASEKPQFPIVIHSTNLHAAIGMEAILEENGWSVLRLAPYGDLEWIGESWLPTIRNMIVSQAERSSVLAVLHET
jgi:CheY-like chemotaxis protein